MSHTHCKVSNKKQEWRSERCFFVQLTFFPAKERGKIEAWKNGIAQAK
jgi:hypothetical protein